MQPVVKQRTKRILIVILILLLTLIIAFFSLRNYALSYVFEKAQSRFKSKYNVELSAGKFNFTGISGIEFSKLILVPQAADTLLKISQLKFDVSVSDLILGKIGFNLIDIDRISISIYNSTNRNNISFLKGKEQKVDSVTVVKPDGDLSYRKMVDKGLSKVFRLLKTQFYMKQFSFVYEDSLRNEHLIIPEIKYDSEKIFGTLIKLNASSNDSLVFEGNVIERRSKYSFSIEDKSASGNYLPFLNTDKNLKVRFIKISGIISFDDESEVYRIKPDVHISGLRINHWRLANEDVVFNNAIFNGAFSITDDAVEIDSTSVFKMNNAPFRLFVHNERKPKLYFNLKVDMPVLPADSFFNSLPDGMFTTLKGIQTAGTLGFHLDFEIDRNQPDSLKFESGFERKNFRIVKYGTENFSRIGNSFLFEAMDGDNKVRDIIVGPESPTFTPLYQISDYLKYAVLTSEDGTFLYHRGFNEDAFRESIITNYKEKRFARGGSTITMQLVKNCFLNRNKTISRKAEEALIVWLIENCGLVSKERMLEVYLNVIEWGPDVYGIGEASGFYFGKQPMDLTLAESIYLASIVPNPKFFKYSFDKEGNLKPYLSNYFRFVSKKMLSREWITPNDTTGLQPLVKLVGPAKQFIIPVDSLFPVDSLNQFQEDLELIDAE